MVILRAGRLAVVVTLMLFGIVLMTVSAQAASPAKTHTKPAPSAVPVVKIDSAMVQERITLPDGTVRTKTYVNGRPVQAAKKPTFLPAPPCPKGKKA